MARHKSSPAEDVIKIVSRLPWWIGCLLALISYLILHYVAGIKVAQPEGVGDFGRFAGKQIYVQLAYFAQYVLPPVLLIGALISAIQNFKQVKRYDTVASKSKPSSLLDMTWQEFEGLTAEFFRKRGYSVALKGGNQPDGGVDVVLSKGSDKYLVQCKQWRAQKVGVQVVRELYGVMTAEGAAGGFVVTSGQFTEEAKKFVDGLNIHLFDGAILHKMIREVKRQTPASSQGNQYDTLVHPAHTVQKICPSCGSDMVKRVAKKGPNTGNQFWGCSTFPRCRAVENI